MLPAPLPCNQGLGEVVRVVQGVTRPPFPAYQSAASVAETRINRELYRIAGSSPDLIAARIVLFDSPNSWAISAGE